MSGTVHKKFDTINIVTFYQFLKAYSLLFKCETEIKLSF